MDPQHRPPSSPGLESHIKTQITLIHEMIKIALCSSGNVLFLSFHQKFQAIMDEIDLALKSNNLRNEVSRSKKELQEKTGEIENQQTDAATRQAQANSALQGKHAPYSYIFIISITLVNLGSCLTEGSLLAPVLLMLGANLLVAFIGGTLFGGGLYYFIGIMPRIVHLGKTVRQRRFIRIALAVFIVVLFFFLSYLRTQYYRAEAAKDNSIPPAPDNPFELAGLSILLFLIAIALHTFCMPTREAEQEMQKFRALKRKKREADTQVNMLAQRMTNVKAEAAQIEKACEQTFLEGNRLENMVLTGAIEGFALYAARAGQSNTDGLIQSEPYPFPFKRNFDLPTS